MNGIVFVALVVGFCGCLISDSEGRQKNDGETDRDAGVTRQVHAVLGDTVTLACKPPDFDTSSERKQYVVWYRGEGRSAIVAFGSDVHADRLRVTSTSDVYGLTSWLTIDNVTLVDQTLYTCQRSGLGARHLAFRLVVDVPPSVDLLPNVSEMEADVGGDVKVTCVARGQPLPRVSWMRLAGGRFVEIGAPEEGSSVLALHHVTPADGGRYECVATNDVRHPSIATVTINVRSTPLAFTSASVVHTIPGRLATLECMFVAYPVVSEVVWVRGGSKVDLLTSTNMWLEVKEEFNGTNTLHYRRLHIQPVSKSDLTSYTCTGTNDLGRASKQIVLTALPVNVDIRSSNVSRHCDRYDVHWTVTSLAPLIDFYIYLTEVQPNSTGTEVKITVPARNDSSSHGNYVHHYWHVLTSLTTSATYHLNLQARNTFGPSQPSGTFHFSLAKTCTHHDDLIGLGLSVRSDSRSIYSPIVASSRASVLQNLVQRVVSLLLLCTLLTSRLCL